MDILVTVGGILLLIVLAALMIHLLNVHHSQSMATHHYDSFHPGDPPAGTGRGGARREGEERTKQGEGSSDDQRDDNQ